MSKDHPYKLKKSLGQHFLKDDKICQRIVGYLQEGAFTQLLEVGPGGGALTKHLLNLQNISFKAVEIDTEKVAFLNATYPTIHGKIINQDFLDMRPPFEGPFTIVGNFPYNISSQILFKAIDWKDQVQGVVGMFQKEVAQRVASGPGSKVYGVTSVLVQAYFDVVYLFDVPPESFTPPPKVMSGVIKLTPKTPPVMSSPKAFKNLVKTAFNQRRKQLRNGVKGLFDEATLKDELFTKRAEQLSIQDFADLTFRMQNPTPKADVVVLPETEG
jgi:16S rRNA (adenine1518-N6/adenine1519-N6)-dimethyltransferase